MKRFLAFAAALSLLTINVSAQNAEVESPYLGHSFTAASGVTWAQCNLGASEPQEFGDYYKWTELSGAEVPAPWRIPTFDEWGELARNYKWEKIKDGNVSLWHVFDKKGNDLYLPVAGAMSGGRHMKFTFEYWTNAKYDAMPARADAAWVYDGQMMMSESMSTGLPVRLVKGDVVHATDLKVPASVEVTMGQFTRVEYSVLPEDADIKLVRFWCSEPSVNVTEDGVVTGVKRGQFTIYADLFTVTGYNTKPIRVTVKSGVSEFSNNASSITALNATISGKFKIDSHQDRIVTKDLYIIYSSEVSGADNLIAEGTRVKLDIDRDGNYKSRLHGLQPATKYNYVIYAYVQGGGKYYSGQESFTTRELTAAGVDLGLPSGTKWSGMNMEKQVAWGMTTSYSNDNDASDNYKDIYNRAEETQLFTPSDYAAQVLGSNWRIPSLEEFRELIATCDIYPYSDNAVELVSKVNGNSIVLPADKYWTSTRQGIEIPVSERSGYESDAYGAEVSLTGINTTLFRRENQHTIRPVWRPVTDKYPADIALSEGSSEQLLKLGESYRVPFILTPSDADPKYVTLSVDYDSPVRVNDDGTVTAVKPGKGKIYCQIYSTPNWKTVIVVVEVYDPEEYVDMGLSVLWARTNLRSYYCWGSGITSSKADYEFWTEKVTMLNKSQSIVKAGLNKYCNNSAFGYKKYDSDGYTDNYTRLLPSDDPAHKGHARYVRMPSLKEWEELANPENCSWENYTLNGVKGVKVISRITGNSIFLPTTGYSLEGKNYGEAGKENAIGRYWAADLYEPYCLNAWTMEFDVRKNGGIIGNVENKMVSVPRWAGQAVRPVLDLK